MDSGKLNLDIKIKGLNRRLKDTDVIEQLEKLQASQPHQIAAVKETFAGIKGTELEGLPATIALMKAKLLPDRAIAEELNIPLKAVRKYSQVPGFDTLMHQLQSSVWSDIILAAQATLLYHISVEKDIETTKWLLERTGQVASTQPLTSHTHQTLVLNGGGANKEMKQITGSVDVTVESICEGLHEKLMKNQASLDAPPVVISE